MRTLALAALPACPLDLQQIRPWARFCGHASCCVRPTMHPGLQVHMAHLGLRLLHRVHGRVREPDRAQGEPCVRGSQTTAAMSGQQQPGAPQVTCTRTRPEQAQPQACISWLHTLSLGCRTLTWRCVSTCAAAGDRLQPAIPHRHGGGHHDPLLLQRRRQRAAAGAHDVPGAPQLEN